MNTSRRSGPIGELRVCLRRDVIAYWGARSIHEIKKRDVSDLVSLVAQRNAHAGHRLLKTLKTFFRWCVGRAVIDFSPAEESRHRIGKSVGIACLLIRSSQLLFYGRPKVPTPIRTDRGIAGIDRSAPGGGRSAGVGRTR